MKGLRWFCKIYFEPRDIWVGVFWKHEPATQGWQWLKYWDIYICLIPCVPIRIYQGLKF